MKYSRARRIYLDVKVWLYRKAFSLAGVRFCVPTNKREKVGKIEQMIRTYIRIQEQEEKRQEQTWLEGL